MVVLSVKTNALLARLDLKARILAWLLWLLARDIQGQGQDLWLPLALAFCGLQAMALYVFGLAGFKATAYMSEQVLEEKFGCTMNKVTMLYQCPYHYHQHQVHHCHYQ